MNYTTSLTPLWTNFDKVHKDSERDYWMKAEAKEYGMIDEVLRRG
jgi:ATP-dependent Clp protease protease subunit